MNKKIIILCLFILFVTLSCTTLDEEPFVSNGISYSEAVSILKQKVIFIIGQRQILNPIVDELQARAPLTVWENADTYLPEASANYLIINSQNQPSDKIYSLPEIGLSESTEDGSVFFLGGRNRIVYITDENHDEIILRVEEIMILLAQGILDYEVNSRNTRNPMGMRINDQGEAVKHHDFWVVGQKETAEFAIEQLRIAKGGTNLFNLMQKDLNGLIFHLLGEPLPDGALPNVFGMTIDELTEKTQGTGVYWYKSNEGGHDHLIVSAIDFSAFELALQENTEMIIAIEDYIDSYRN